MCGHATHPGSNARRVVNADGTADLALLNMYALCIAVAPFDDEGNPATPPVQGRLPAWVVRVTSPDQLVRTIEDLRRNS